jgi:bacterioferritin-associated ferredoxin
MDALRDPCNGPERCADCPQRLVCRCLGITEAVLRKALLTFDLRTVQDIRRHTGAGDGCTACHGLLRRFLEGPAEPQPQPA